MSLVLNTNIDAMIAQNSLTASGSQLATALQQLSSGLRINTAADDAAGYAIAQGMTSQINGLNQAAQNANDGVSLAQTASGAMQEVVNNLQTMRDLAVESLNASNSANDRADLNAQFQQLAADINSVASQTQFNGVNLLDGSFQGQTFQVGANAGQSITMSAISSVATDAIGTYYTTAATTGSYSATNITNGDQAVLDIKVGSGSQIQATVTLTGNQTTDMKAIAAAITQAVGSSDGIVATVDTSGSKIDLSTASASAQSVTVSLDASSTFANTTTPPTLTDLGVDGTYALGSASPNTKNSLANTDVTGVDKSNLVLISVDNALQQLATSSANLGAYQNRFQAAITGLTTDATNLTSAKSAIVDTNYAQATTELSKAQILQQAGTAMVAQANTIPQNILTLLQKLP